MSTSTPTKLITDYFPKTPTLDDNVSTKKINTEGKDIDTPGDTHKQLGRRRRRRKKKSLPLQPASTTTKPQTLSESQLPPPVTLKPEPVKPKKKSSSEHENKLLTDYFPVRRSGRICQSKIKEDKDKLLRDCIINKCENGLKVVQIEGKGRGVEATKSFETGDFVIEYAGDLIELTAAKERESNYSKNEDVGCYMYYFEHKSRHYCVDATEETGHLGRLVNHSKKGNCQTKVIEVNSKPRLILVAVRNIRVGEELLYDYGDRSPSSLEAHPWLKL